MTEGVEKRKTGNFKLHANDNTTLARIVRKSELEDLSQELLYRSATETSRLS